MQALKELGFSETSFTTKATLAMMFRFYVLQLTAVYIYASGHMVCGFNESGSLEYDSTSLGDENSKSFQIYYFEYNRIKFVIYPNLLIYFKFYHLKLLLA